MQVEIERIVIAGYGRMGSWLAHVLSHTYTVAVYDAKPIDQAGMEIKILKTPEEIRVFAPDLLINAVSAGMTVDAFKMLHKYIPSETIIADIATIKSDLPQYYSSTNNSFASFHPMFGPTFASMNDLKGKNFIIIKESDESTKGWANDLFKSIGLSVLELTFEEHDRAMVNSLTLPVVLSILFAGAINENDIPGTSYMKYLGLADSVLSEDRELLVSILNNAGSGDLIKRVTESAGNLMQKIKDGEDINLLLNALRQKLPMH